jgi:hypothetical protein
MARDDGSMSDVSSSTIRITHFRVERELGRDALGYVFHALDEQLERPVALRVARAAGVYGAPDVAAARARFRDKARRAATISHPNLVTIYEFRALTETDLFVMELVEGDTLAELIDRNTRWTVIETARIIARLADALAAAHEAGLVHGRVSARNIRVRPDGRIKLLDLGVPHEPADELAGEPAFRDDLRGLARIACQMLSPTQQKNDDAVFAALRDAVTARARYGFLAPVLLRAIGDRSTGAFSNAGEFRDTLVLALDAATQRSNPDGRDDEGRWSTRVVGPDRTVEDRLPADARALSAMGRAPAPGRRLVLPPGFVDKSPIPEDRLGASIMRNKQPRAPIPARIAVTVAILAALGAVGWIAYQRFDATRPDATQTATAEEFGADVIAIAPEPIDPLYAKPPAGESVSDAGALPDSAELDGAAETLPPVNGAAPAAESSGIALSAMVRGSPAGTSIAVVGDATRRWTDAVELSVPSGESIELSFSRPGYVSQTHTFTGTRLAVALQPDSVLAAFDANVQATVFLVTGAGEQRLGTTPTQVSLPTGSPRITFRSPGQPDWTTVQDMTQPGRRYTITKTDYVTTGDLIVSVNGTWAMISLDDGPDRETPVRFEDIPVGEHVLRVSREGFQTIVDTVVVRAGAPVSRQYTLRR